MWRRAVQAGNLGRLRDRPSSELKSQDRDFRWFWFGLVLLSCGHDKRSDTFVGDAVSRQDAFEMY
jgi:hypothetical protein